MLAAGSSSGGVCSGNAAAALARLSASLKILIRSYVTPLSKSYRNVVRPVRRACTMSAVQGMIRVQPHAASASGAIPLSTNSGARRICPQSRRSPRFSRRRNLREFGRLQELFEQHLAGVRGRSMGREPVPRATSRGDGSLRSLLALLATPRTD